MATKKPSTGAVSSKKPSPKGVVMPPKGKSCPTCGKPC